MNPNLLRGRVLMDQGRHELAVAEFRLALAQTPDDSYAHSNLALALIKLERWQEAKESAITAVAKGPDDAFAHWVLAVVLLEREHWKEAETAIRTAIELDPEDASNHGLLARLLLEQHRAGEALVAADAGLALDPEDDMSLTYRARALMELGRKGEARAVADTMLAEAPDDAWNHFLRGDQLLAEGNASEARNHYLEALRLDPGMDEARLGFATSLKSRSPVYAILLRMLRLAGSLRGWAAWGVVILSVGALRFGDAWAGRNPSLLVPYEAAKAVLWAFLILLVIADPLFDLLLRWDKEGRRALSADEQKATNWYLVCFAMAALCALWAFKANSTGAPKRLGVGFLFLTQAVGAAFRSTPGFVRKWMGMITRFAAACLVLAPVVGMVGVIRGVANRSKVEMLI